VARQIHPRVRVQLVDREPFAAQIGDVADVGNVANDDPALVIGALAAISGVDGGAEDLEMVLRGREERVAAGLGEETLPLIVDAVGACAIERIRRVVESEADERLAQPGPEGVLRGARFGEVVPGITRVERAFGFERNRLALDGQPF
jgi:hypothetical protein